jgi:hypothetical protein
MKLPFLVTYGAWVWKLIALACALVALFVADIVRSWAERRRTRLEHQRRMAEVSAPVLAKAEGLVSVTGTLHGGMATTLMIGQQAYHDRAGDLWVDVKGERLDLGGTVHVFHGTSASASRALPRSTPRGIRDAIARAADGASRVSQLIQRAAGGRVHRLARVQDGDMVIVRGMLGGTTGGVDRFGVRSWILQPPAERGEIELAAVSPTSRAVPIGALAAVVLAAGVASAACGAMYGIGKRSLESGHTRTGDIGAFDPLAIAAAMPFTRAAALEAIAQRIPGWKDAVEALRK